MKPGAVHWLSWWRGLWTHADRRDDDGQEEDRALGAHMNRSPTEEPQPSREGTGAPGRLLREDRSGLAPDRINGGCVCKASRQLQNEAIEIPPFNVRPAPDR
jgi:hypothetical protein